MSGPEEDIVSPFVTKLGKTYADRGGVSCTNLVGPGGISGDPLIDELVFSMLMWESSIDHALKGVHNIREVLVDLNELRVCTVSELASILGSRTPRGPERAQRLIGILSAIFERENRLSLGSLREMNKREVQDYLGAIDALPPYVSGRVILLELGWHAFPVDDRLTRLLAGKGITDPTLDATQQAHRLERLVRASDSLAYYTLIEHWSQSQRTPSRSGSRSRSRSGSRAVGTPTGSDHSGAPSGNGEQSGQDPKGSH